MGLRTAISTEGLSSRALAKGLALLEHLASHGEPQGLVALSQAIQLGKASTLRLLQTLTATGFATQDMQGRYMLNRRWMSRSTAEETRSLVEAALPVMRDLHADLAESVSLSALEEDHIRVLAVLDSPRSIRMSNSVGRILPPYGSSMGKAITAFQEPEVQERLVEVYGIYKFTTQTISEPLALRAEYARVRENGYALEKQETIEGGCCFAAPLRSADGRVWAALSVSLPLLRLSPELEATLPGRLCGAAREINPY